MYRPLLLLLLLPMSGRHLTSTGDSTLDSSRLVIDATTGLPYRPVPRMANPQLQGSLGPEGTRYHVLWVQTNGIYLSYSASGEYANCTSAINAHPQVDLTVKSSGTITLAELNQYDAVIVPSVGNYYCAWTTPEYDAFEQYARSGGCLYLWTDNPGASHVALDPLLARFGLSRTNGLAAGNDWPVLLAAHPGKVVSGLYAGNTQGGTSWLSDANGSMGEWISAGAGAVWLHGDVNTYAQAWDDADNTFMLAVVLKACGRG